MTDTDLTPQEDLQRKQLEELFRYTDLSHPVMQTLFDIQLNKITAETTEG